MDAPQAPQDAAAQALGLQRAEDDAAILQRHRMQGHTDVEMADTLNVLAVLVHEEQLQGRRGMLGRDESVAVASEGEAASRQWARAHVEHAVVEVRLARLGLAAV